MKRRVLLVDDEVSILLTFKAVLEISGFDVDTAASAREGKHKIKRNQYDMIITDMRMENDDAGIEVIACARTADYKPAVALLSAFPVEEEDWQAMGADQMLVKATNMRVLLGQLEALLARHQARQQAGAAAAKPGVKKPVKKAKPAVKKTAAKAAKKTAAKKTVKPPARKKAVKRAAKKTAAKRVPAKKKSSRRK